MLPLWIWISLASGAQSGSSVTPVPMQPFQNTSSIFHVVAGGAAVGCEAFLDYHVARFQMEMDGDGFVAVEITAPEPIVSVSISPLVRRIPVTVSGSTMRLRVSAAPAYLIIRANLLPMLVLLVDHPTPTPAGAISVLEFRADPSGERDTTTAIQSAIDVGAAKGQPVLVPPGTFLVTRPLTIRNGSHLHVQAGGVLRSSPDLDTLVPGWQTNLSNCPKLPPVLQGDNVHNVLLEGLGTVDASGFALMRSSPVGTCLPSGQVYRRRLLSFTGYTAASTGGNITVRDLVCRDATTWTLVVAGASHVQFLNLKVLNWQNASVIKIENDGLDLIGGSHSRVDSSLVITCDDAMCAKSTLGPALPMTNVTFENNVVWSSCAGNKVGTECSDGAKSHIVFRNNDIVQARRGVVAENRHGGGLVSDVLFEDLRVERLIETQEHHLGAKVKPIIPLQIHAQTSSIHGLTLRNISWLHVGTAASLVAGTSPHVSVRDVKLEQLSFDGKLARNAHEAHVQVGEYAYNITVDSTA